MPLLGRLTSCLGMIGGQQTGKASCLRKPHRSQVLKERMRSAKLSTIEVPASADTSRQNSDALAAGTDTCLAGSVDILNTAASLLLTSIPEGNWDQLEDAEQLFITLPLGSPHFNHGGKHASTPAGEAAAAAHVSDTKGDATRKRCTEYDDVQPACDEQQVAELVTFLTSFGEDLSMLAAAAQQQMLDARAKGDACYSCGTAAGNTDLLWNSTHSTLVA